MPAFSFSRSKRHNIVEVALTYECVNDRFAIASETRMLAELSNLMASVYPLHKHGNTVIEPTIHMTGTERFIGTVDLKFQVSPSVMGSDGLKAAFSYGGLHATLVEILRIVNHYRSDFIQLGVRLNLSAMTSPWVLPVKDHGVIMRRGGKHLCYSVRDSASSFVKDTNKPLHRINTDSMYVVGEPLAVKEFNKRWMRKVGQAHQIQLNACGRIGNGPSIDIEQMRKDHPNLPWHNLAVYVKERDTDQWHLLGKNRNEMSLEYNFHMGNMMLTEPMGYDNDATEPNGNVFLSDHDYFEFTSPIA